MIELTGKYNNAKVFTDNIESSSITQIIELCNQEFTSGSKIRIMPDVHAGAGCTIGTTMTIQDKVVPNLVGVDIGCGMEVLKLKEKEIDFAKLDEVIRKCIPSGYNIRGKEHPFNSKIDLNKLKYYHQINHNRARLSIGTLGGGNHFIEIDKDENGDLYLVIHSGSRYLGKQIAEHYQELAIVKLLDKRQEKEELINKLKSEGREKEIDTELKKIQAPNIRKELAYLDGQDLENYLNDMQIAQDYATINRKAMAQVLVEHMQLNVIEQFTTIHNYIELESRILRKGAISAKQGEKVIIPINMRDGCLIAEGKGNPDWNYSAPHGAGRILSRGKAKELIDIEEYKESMEGVWSTSVREDTIDEAPMAYKDIEEIIENTKDTIDIIHKLKPVYNFKS